MVVKVGRRVVHFDQKMIAARMQNLRDLKFKLCVSALMRADHAPIQPDVCFIVNAVKVQPHRLALLNGRRIEVALISGIANVLAIALHHRPAMRHRHVLRLLVESCAKRPAAAIQVDSRCGQCIARQTERNRSNSAPSPPVLWHTSPPGTTSRTVVSVATATKTIAHSLPGNLMPALCGHKIKKIPSRSIARCESARTL